MMERDAIKHNLTSPPRSSRRGHPVWRVSLPTGSRFVSFSSQRSYFVSFSSQRSCWFHRNGSVLSFVCHLWEQTAGWGIRTVWMLGWKEIFVAVKAWTWMIDSSDWSLAGTWQQRPHWLVVSNQLTAVVSGRFGLHCCTIGHNDAIDPYLYH